MKEKNHFGFLLKENLNIPINKIESDDSSEAYQAYLSMVDEFFAEFGTSDDLKKETRLKRKLIKLYLRHAQTGKRSLLNDIMIVSEDLKKLMKDVSVVNHDYAKEVSTVGKILNMFINTKKISVYEYEMSKKAL